MGPFDGRKTVILRLLFEGCPLLEVYLGVPVQKNMVMCDMSHGICLSNDIKICKYLQPCVMSANFQIKKTTIKTYMGSGAFLPPTFITYIDPHPL